MKILCIGESILETTCQINEILNEGQKLLLTEKNENGGGHAGNVAYLLGKWGIETYIASMLGADDSAEKIKKEFENIGVRTDFIETSYDKSTGSSLVLINTTNKNNTIFHISSNSFLKKYSFTIEPDVIVTDGNDFNASVAAFDKYPKKLNFLLVSKASNEIMELCRYANNIIFNQSSAEGISNIKIDKNNSSTLVDAYNKLKQKYDRANIIITLGEKGCIYSINGQVKIMPPINLEIVDTNGAGDVFAGAFVYGIAREFGLEKSIAYATIAASMSVTKLTGRMSIPSISEVSNYYDGKFGAQNNPNNTNIPQPQEKIQDNGAVSMSTNEEPIIQNPINQVESNNDNQENS